MKKPHHLLFAAILLAASAHGQTHYKVTHVDENVNSAGADMGAAIIDDSILLYSSMQTDVSNIVYLTDFTPLVEQLFQSEIDSNGDFRKGETNQWGVNRKGKNCGSPAFDPESRTLYYVQHDWGNDYSRIYYSREEGGRWSTPRLVGGNVNLRKTNSTHPTVGRTRDGRKMLFFASDRPGGQGGYDLYGSVLLSGERPGNPANLGPAINSDSNDITPFLDPREGVLYFASNRAGGLGGFDVYAVPYPLGETAAVRSLGREVNSPHNDLFFYVCPAAFPCQSESAAADEAVEACGFLSSNRDGSLYRTEANCCNDLYRWTRFRRVPAAAAAAAALPATRPQDLLPLPLYFHNDEPDPASPDTATRQRYAPTLRRFLQLRDIYKGSQPSPVDSRKWDSIQRDVDLFFDLELRDSPALLDTFFRLLYADLRAGRRVELTVDGYASPLYENGYNLALSKRRICCFKNELIAWNENALLPFLNGGSLKIVGTAHGAPSASEVALTSPLRNPKSARSVFSLQAARDRRIEILSYRYF